MKKFIAYCVSLLFLALGLCIIWAVANFKIHDFEGKCLECHKDMPDKDTKREKLIFVDEIDSLCGRCHTINKNKSHPINIRPGKDNPLTAHLDKNGLITCTTCHDIHKEDKTSNRQELAGLLWGHVKGKAFCFICHNNEAEGINWRHQTAIPYAHSLGRLTENAASSLLDKYSTECLSCHDGTISKFPQVQVKQGNWQHGIGISHPIGINYPRSEEFVDIESLPKNIRIFDSKIGCLSCHDIYGKQKNLLVMDNKKSRLCLACHKK